MLLRSQSRQLLDMPSTVNRSKIMNTLPTPINIEPKIVGVLSLAKLLEDQLGHTADVDSNLSTTSYRPVFKRQCSKE